jgi:Rad3-related DNA helicase
LLSLFQLEFFLVPEIKLFLKILKSQVENPYFKLKLFTYTKIKGKEWYTQQATRAVNQAIGRVIRHKDDYGAIILLDERFSKASGQISKWLRPQFKSFSRYFRGCFFFVILL